jgi:hypothetical protein
MKTTMVRYKVKPDRVAENEELVEAVYEELARTKPDGLRYATFRLEDGVSFMHVASVDTENGKSPLQQVEAFRRFTANVEDRTDEAPVATQIKEIGSYRVCGNE